MEKRNNRAKFNIFYFASSLAKSLIEIFISLYLFKNGFSIQSIIIFYILENLFAIFLSYLFVRIGEKYKYTTVMFIGVISFIALQIVLNNLSFSFEYLVLISFLYSAYRRGYWVAGRFYLTEVMPHKDSSVPFSITVSISEIASIAAGYIGGFLLDNVNAIAVTVLSSLLLVFSTIPLLKIKHKKECRKIELIKNIRKYDKRNYLAFSLYEINNLLTFIFPIYIAVYIQDTYVMAGSVNAVSNLAIILFILLYGRVIRKRNYFVISSILFILVSLTKLLFLNYFVLIFYFVEGVVKKMQNQSVNKIYFENRNGMDLTHYNLIYQLIEAVARSVAAVPLLFIDDIRLMILFVLIIIGAELIIFASLKRDKKLS